MKINRVCFLAIICLSPFVHKTDSAIFNVPNGDLSALKSAITIANTNGEDDTIELANSGSYILTAADNYSSGYNGLPVLGSDGGRRLLIEGNGATIARSTADGTGSFRIFDVESGAKVAMHVLTISNGLSEGGGIANGGELTLDDCVLTGNSADDSVGGGILNLGQTLVVKNCVFSDNVGAGGGIFSEGTATISDSLFRNNSGYDGGAIYVNAFSADTMLIIHGCTFTNNSATTDIGGGAIYSEAEHHNVSIEIDSSVFQGNSAGDQGGAICTFSLGFSTVTMALINCTLVDNSAREGGAIYNFSHGDGDAFSTLQVTNTTFSGNVATFGGAVYNDPSSSSGYATLRNTILQAGSSGGTLFGLTSSRGHNLCSDSGGGFLTEPGDQINTDPKLDSGGLQNNGGPTKTIALQPTSPAINNGDPDAPAQDQRYYLRSGVPDIGAFEFGGSVAPMTVVSRKTHGTGGSTFDINLPLTGTPLGVECRRNTGADISGPNVGRDHEIILTFPTAVTVGGASVTSNDMADMPTATFSVSSNVVTVDLHNIANARRLTINLTNASDGVNTNNVNFPMGVLLGDVTNNTVVSNTDIASIKGQVAASVTSANFRNDVTANGIVSNTDVSTAKAQVGTTLP